MRKPFVTKRIVKLAKKIKAKVILEPQYGFVGHLTFLNGRKTLFRDTSFNINALGSVQIAKDKGYSSFFLKKFGYSVPKDLTIYTDKLNDNIRIKRNIKDGYNFAKHLGFPVILKPNDKSKGEGVVKVYNKREYLEAAKQIFKENKVMLVQEYCEGRDFRIVVLDKKIISAYERIPLNVIGDGKSTILQLLKQKQKQFDKIGRDTKIDLTDFRIIQNLKRNKLNYKSILAKMKSFTLINIANLSAGGNAVDFTFSIHPEYKRLAINVTNDMCLRLCGVDILTNNITK